MRVAVENPRPGGGISKEHTIAALNPEPVNIFLTPDRIAADSEDTRVLVRGSGITPASELRWNGAVRPARFFSPGTLELTIPAADIPQAGAVSISVTNPAPGGGAASYFLIVTPSGSPNLALPVIIQSPAAQVNAADAQR